MAGNGSIQPRYATQEEFNRRTSEAINRLLRVVDSNNVRSPTADFTVSYEAGVYLVDCTSGAVTVTLPPAANYKGSSFHIKKIDNSANGITIDPYSTETIDGNTTIAINLQYVSYRLSSDGSNWYIT